MSRYWNPDVHKLSPYIPGEQPREREWVKLNTNELPEGPSPQVFGGPARGLRRGIAALPRPGEQAATGGLGIESRVEASSGVPRQRL